MIVSTVLGSIGYCPLSFSHKPTDLVDMIYLLLNIGMLHFSFISINNVFMFLPCVSIVIIVLPQYKGRILSQHMNMKKILINNISTIVYGI